MTAAKEDMTNINKSDLDRAVSDFLEQTVGHFVVEQAEQWINKITLHDRLKLPQSWPSLLKRHIEKHCNRARYVDSGRPLETQIDGKTYRHIFHKSYKTPSLATDKIRREIVKNGGLSGKKTAGLGERLKLLQGGKAEDDEEN